MLQGMATDTMDPATAVTWGPFIQAAHEQFVSDPSEVNPSTIKNMPAGYTLVRTIQMTDFFGPLQTRVFYGFVAVGGDPKTAVVALHGTASNTALEPELRARAEHLPARALARHGAAGPGLQASLPVAGLSAHPRSGVPTGTRARAAAGSRIRVRDTPSP
jgi:hypothetical protein